MFKPRLKEGNRKIYILDDVLKKELEKLCLEKNAHEIGILWDIHFTIIAKWIRYFKIPIDRSKIQKQVHNRPEVSERMRKAHTSDESVTKYMTDEELKLELQKLYLDEKKGIPTIGKILNLGRTQAWALLRRFNIPIREQKNRKKNKKVIE